MTDTQKELSLFFREAEGKHLLVIGDLMLDRYMWGSVERISPEAPVPVVEVDKEESRPGGAANVALNLAALGAKVSLTGVIGKDSAGETLLELLGTPGFDTSLVMVEESRKTTAKIRILGNGQQVLRVDREDRFPLANDLERLLLDRLGDSETKFDAIIFEDYDKGFISPTLIRGVVGIARKKGIPVIVDPKFKQFMDYAGVSLFKPNLKELNEALGLKLRKTEFEGIGEAVEKLREYMPHGNTVITLAEQGMLAFNSDGQMSHFPAHLRKIRDVSGAGDTVVSVLGLALACGLSLSSATELANLAGGLVCEEVGVAPIDRKRLQEEAERVT